MVKEGIKRGSVKLKEGGLGGGRFKESVLVKQTKKSNSLRREPVLKPKETFSSN